jgi:hypothetical protein
LHQVSADPQALLHGLGKSLHDPFTPQDLLPATKSLGLKAKPAASTPERLKLAPLPALALHHRLQLFAQLLHPGQIPLILPAILRIRIHRLLRPFHGLPQLLHIVRQRLLA